MKRAVILQHAPFEGPGLIASLLWANGYQLDVRHLDRGEGGADRIRRDTDRSAEANAIVGTRLLSNILNAMTDPIGP